MNGRPMKRTLNRILLISIYGPYNIYNKIYIIQYNILWALDMMIRLMLDVIIPDR